MLCNSGFADYVMFLRNGPNIQIQAWSMRRSELFTVTRQAALLKCAPGGEVCYRRLLCY